MLDARNIFRKVTRKIYDFSPEQLQNILAIVWLYRGQRDRFLKLVGSHLEKSLIEANSCFELQIDNEIVHPLPDYAADLDDFLGTMQPFLDSRDDKSAFTEVLQQLTDEMTLFNQDVDTFKAAVRKESGDWKTQKHEKDVHKTTAERIKTLADSSHDMVKQADLLYKLACRLVDICENELDAREWSQWSNRDIQRTIKAAMKLGGLPWSDSTRCAILTGKPCGSWTVFQMLNYVTLKVS
jgi:type I restriction enzyme M protein